MSFTIFRNGKMTDLSALMLDGRPARDGTARRMNGP